LLQQELAEATRMIRSEFARIEKRPDLKLKFSAIHWGLG